MNSPRIIDSAFYPDPSVRDAWEVILSRLQQYSYFQTPAWSDLLSLSLPQAKPFHIWSRFEDGVEVILPLFRLRKWHFLRKLESLPWGCYGGWLSESPLTAHHRKMIVRQALGVLRPVATIVANPLDTDALDGLTPQNRLVRDTYVVDTSQGFDSLWKSFQPRNRTTIRRALDQGIRVYWGNGTREVDILIDLYHRAQESWSGVETLPDAFFEALKTGSNDETIRIWIAEMDGTPAAADLFLYGKREAQYFAGASDRQFTRLNASRLLISEALRDACEEGLSAVNLGASGNQDGVERFKRLFAGEKRRYWVVQFKWL